MTNLKNLNLQHLQNAQHLQNPLPYVPHGRLAGLG